MGRTLERVQAMYHWDNMSQDVKQFKLQYPDCVTAAPPPHERVLSQGNVVPDNPFHTLGMDFAVTLPKTPRGNTVLCVWVCWFTGYVILFKILDHNSLVACSA